MGLSPTMGFSMKMTVAYFAILGEFSSGMSFTLGFFKILSSLQGEGRKDILCNTLMF